jgi:hypothetical protein
VITIVDPVGSSVEDVQDLSGREYPSAHALP